MFIDRNIIYLVSWFNTMSTLVEFNVISKHFLVGITSVQEGTVGTYVRRRKYMTSLSWVLQLSSYKIFHSILKLFIYFFLLNIEFIYKQKQCLIDVLNQIAKGIIKTSLKFMYFLFLKMKYFYRHKHYTNNSNNLKKSFIRKLMKL